MPAGYEKMKASMKKQKMKHGMDARKADRAATTEAAKTWNKRHKGGETVGRGRA